MQNKEQQPYADKYRLFFEHASCGLFISSKEGRFIDVNQALVDILGYDTKEELLEIDLVCYYSGHPCQRGDALRRCRAARSRFQ